MTSGPRRIRVACAKCDYDKVRTLEAGDDRTLEQLSASLRCGGCRTWGRNGAVSVTIVDFDAGPRPHPVRRHEVTSDAADHKVSANNADKADPQPRYMHCVCLDCGHNENFRPRWRRGDTLDSVARESTCPACGAEGSAGNIYLRAAAPRARRQRPNKSPLHLGASILATLAWPFEMLGLLIVVPMAAIATVSGRLLRQVLRPLLIGGGVTAGIAASVGAAYLAAVLIGAALSAPATLVMRAVEHEHQDNVRNSPRGGYLERVDRKYADTPKQMQYYNQRRVDDKDRD
jgi:hypothetical protein